MNHETETIDKLFLELSQFTQAKTKREIELEQRIEGLTKDIEKLYRLAKDSDETEDIILHQLTENLRILSQR